MKKISTLFLISLFCLFSVSAFDWPQEEHATSTLSSYYGQNMGNQISSSLIFSEPAEIKAIKDGKILIIMTDITDDCDFFPSTLGTSVIIAHDDDLLSVYGNLDKESVIDAVQNKSTILQGEKIGESGNSGWQKKRSALEFQIIDTQKSVTINPRILLPREEQEVDLTVTGILLQNKNGDFFDLREHRNFPSGIYKVYQTRNKAAAPYKTTVTINGVVVDQISYDTIHEENGKTYVIGKKKYISSDIYPNENIVLLGETMLTPGKSTLGLAADDILGKQKLVNYIISVY